MGLAAAACKEDEPSGPPPEPSPAKVSPAPDTQGPAEKPSQAPPPTPPPPTPTEPPKKDEPPPRPVTKSPVPASACNVGKDVHLGQAWDAEWAGKESLVRVQIVRPEPNQVLQSSLLTLEVRLQGFQPYKTDRVGGNHLRILLDNEEPRDWYDPDEQSFAIEGVNSGLHTVRVFAAKPWHECIKGPYAFDAVNFYVRSDRDQPPPLDLSQPMLSYSVPAGTYKDVASQRILLDWHLANVELAPNGHKVRFVLDGGAPLDFAAWSPVWLENLKPGEHTVKLTLLDPSGKPVQNPFNEVDQTFKVERER